MYLSFIIFAVVTASPVVASAKSWYNAYDIGLYGLYPSQSYVSFDLESPRVDIQQWDAKCDHDYTLLTPRGESVATPGPMILDPTGNLVWMEKRFGEVMDMKMQSYHGEDFLTFWAGTDDGTHGRGTYYMLNSSYDVVHEISAAGGLEGDLHEFKMTEDGTALITIYEITPADLSVFGIKSGWIYDCLFQEIDIATGDLLFQWRASDHYEIHETFRPIGNLGKSKDTAFDYFHINSIAKDPEGNYYISSRYMHTITGITPTGEILWILGGKRNQFTDLSGGAATNFSWQHHADWHPNNTITIFDNGATDSISTADYSRGLMVSLDTDRKTATLLSDFVAPQKFLSTSQGSVQILSDTGNVFVGWGHSAAYSEFTPDGEVLCDMHFGASLFYSWGRAKSYRVFKSPWVGKPRSPPSIKMPDQKSAFVSWNGATEVRSWSLQGANLYEDADDGEELEFVEVERVLKMGFETSFDVDDQMDEYIRIAALDFSGKVLGYSAVVERRTRKLVSADTLEPLDEEEEDFISIQTWILSAGFICGVLLIWYFRRELFERFSDVYHTPLIRRLNQPTVFQRIPSIEID